MPIGHITNGVHVHTWLAPQMRLVYDRHLGADWARAQRAEASGRAIESIDDGELWETHQTLKTRLIQDVHGAARCSRPSAGASRRRSLAQLNRALSPDALTIGFARRFATYKRANLLLQDIEALAALVNDPQMPVQFIFAGKAHPLDRPGQGDPAGDRAADARSALPRARSSSSRTTTSTSAATSCRASTSG